MMQAHYIILVLTVSLFTYSNSILYHRFYSTIDICQFDREIVAVSISIMGRFLSTQNVIAQRALQDRDEFQLVAISALYMTIKIHNKMFLSSGFFADVSQGIYTIEEIEDMELAILQGLSWRIYAPTSIQMVYNILSLVLPNVNLPESTWGYILDEVRYQTEVSLQNYNLSSKQRSSTVAMAAIFNAVLQLNDKQDQQSILRALSAQLLMSYDFDFQAIMATVRRMRHPEMVADEEDTEEEYDYDDDNIICETYNHIEKTTHALHAYHKQLSATNVLDV